ncbi:MAG: tetratricopeptide repeat protein [Acidobacteriota bacterium]
MKAIRRFPSFLTLLIFASLSLALAGAGASISAQTEEEYKAMRAEALALYEQHRMADAVPILEKLHAANPNDALVLSRLAFATLSNSATMQDAEARKQTRIRARGYALKARELGETGSLMQGIIDIPPDGSESGFSNRKEVEAAMRDGEAAFARGDFKKALAAYERALQLDPRQYEAALFTGDVYFKQQKMEQAGEWFAKAIAIEPNRETAYRYWGDALEADGKRDQARDKFIDAIIAEPYSRSSWVGLSQWGRRNGVQLTHPRIEIPRSSVQRKDDNNISIFVNPSDKDDGTNAWMIYSLMKAGWVTGENFKKAFPNEKEYRHSLPEEAGSLRLAAESVVNQLKDGKLKEKSLDVSIANLLKLHRAGLIEPFVLLAIPDEGIASDYEAYRKGNRAKLRQYLLEYVVANK